MGRPKITLLIPWAGPCTMCHQCTGIATISPACTVYSIGFCGIPAIPIACPDIHESKLHPPRSLVITDGFQARARGQPESDLFLSSDTTIFHYQFALVHATERHRELVTDPATSARDCAKRRWCGSEGRRPQTRHGCLITCRIDRCIRRPRSCEICACSGDDGACGGGPIVLNLAF
jgi:hypothetical protein